MNIPAKYLKPVSRSFNRCILLCASYLDVLVDNNMTPIIVMDGRKLKEKTVNENRARYFVFHDFLLLIFTRPVYNQDVVYIF